MSWFAGKKLLVPLDFGEKSKMALDASLDMASGEDVYVIHVAADLATASPEVIWDSHTDEVRRENIEASFHKEFAADKYRNVRFHVSFGDPGHAIADFAEKNGVDVIVMPSHGRTGLKRLLLGAVAERALRRAHCPVLVLRQSESFFS